LKTVSLYDEFLKGLWRQNPIFKQVLAMCPTLAVTNSAENGLAMGLAVVFVLVSSSAIVSIFRRFIPHEVRIAAYTVIIASFVTVADLFLAAKFPALSKALGPYVPLIVVNCIILGRAEAFASKNPVARSILDALGMGFGFTLSLLMLASIRELLGSGTLFGIRMLGAWFEPWVIMVLPAGAFITLGLLIGLINMLARIKGKEKVGCCK